MIRILVTKEFWKEVRRRTFVSDQKLSKYLYSIWVLANKSPQWIKSLIIKWIGTLFSRTPLCLFPQPSFSLPDGSMNKMAMVAGSEFAHVLSHTDFHSQSLTWLWPLLSAQFASSREQNWALTMVQLLRVISQLPGDRWTIWDLFIKERAETCPHWNRHTCGYEFPHSACNASAKTPIHGLTKRLFQHYGIEHNIASDQCTHLLQTKRGSGLPLITSSGLTLLLIFLK